MKFFLHLICYVIYPFSFLFPRKRNRYAFGSFRGSFNDNAKYLLIYTLTHRPEIDAAWLSLNRNTVKTIRNMGLRAYWTVSPKGLWHALTSRYWFFNAYTSDIMYCLSGGAICVNLWHGVGIKRIEYNITTGPLALRYQKKNKMDVFLHPESFRKPDYIISSTPFQNEFFSTSFRVSVSRCMMTGYPRNSILNTTDDERSAFIDRYEPAETRQLIAKLKNYERVYVYMPTWRDSQLSLFAESMDLKRLNTMLQQQNEFLIMKPHANVLSEVHDTGFTNILFVEGGMDIYPVLPYTDVLITDYSSVLYDYTLLRGKGVILYNYDYEDYVGMRDFYFPYDENVVGKRVTTFDELVKCIENHDYQLPDSERLRLVDKFWGKTSQYNASKEIIDAIENLN